MKLFVITTRANQLGNRLFQFAHIMATAIDAKASVLNLPFADYAPHFVLTKDKSVCRFPARNQDDYKLVNAGLKLVTNRLIKFEKVVQNHPSIFRCCTSLVSGWDSTEETSNGIQQLDSAENQKIIRQKKIIFFDGPLFSNFPALKTHQQAVRDFFLPLPEYVQAAAEIAKKARSNADILVGIHIRRTDYKYFMEGAFFFSIHHYADKIREMMSLFPEKKVRFLISSDEKLSQSDFANLPTSFSSGHLIEDLIALAHCDYILGPPSTFSAWAAFYGQKKYFHLRNIQEELRLKNFSTYF